MLFMLDIEHYFPKSIEQSILTAVKTIIQQISASVTQTLAELSRYFQQSAAQWVIGTQGINITFVPHPLFL